MKKATIAVLLAEGFEEIEAITVIDVLRRASFEVAIAAVDDHVETVTGAHGVSLRPDRILADLVPEELDMVVLPGGMPGSANLAASEGVRRLLRAVYDRGGMLAAICAAPIALQAADLLHGRRITSYPSFRPQFTEVEYSEKSVEVDARIITSRGPGTALWFALELVRQVGDAATAKQLREAMLVHEME